MPTDFSLRLATSEDLPALQRLVSDSIRVHCRSHYTLAQIEGMLTHTTGRYDDLVAEGRYFALVKDGTEVVGCGGWSARPAVYGTPQRGASPGPDEAWIRGIYVHPSYSRRGLGSMVVRKCEEAAAAMRFCKFNLGSTVNAVPMYLANGYRKVREEVDGLPNGEKITIVMMRKDLTGESQGC